MLQQLFGKVVIPRAVETELGRVTVLKQEIDKFMTASWVEVREISLREEYQQLRKSLDAGESEAIILARELGAEMLLMDENRGRQIAHEMNIPVLGLIGVLIKAKRTGIIPALKPDLDKLINDHGFWVQKDLYANILKAAGEKG